jgi:ferritin-like protein
MAMLATISSAQFSRRTLLKGASAAGLGLTLGNARLLRSAAQESPDLQQIANIASTAEELVITLFGYAIDSAQQGNYDKPISKELLDILVAAQSAENYHLEFLLESGAKPLTDTFTLPDPTFLTTYDKLFGTLVELEGAFVSAYIVAARAFSDLKQPELVKVSLSVAAVEGEHRVLANYALGTRPANDIAFAPKTYKTFQEAAAMFLTLGYINGDGMEVTYPGPGKVDRNAVTLPKPNGPSVEIGM